MSKFLTLLVIAAAMAWAALVQAAERAAADVTCEATDKKLIYDCKITLKGRNSGKPLENAVVKIKVDMPSMAMVHNVKPVTAEAMAGPGQYQATLEMEMYGDWVLTLDISGPIRDRLIRKLRFGEMKMKPKK